MKTGFSQVRYDERIGTFRMGGNFLIYSSEDCTLHTPLYVSAWAYDAGENSFIWASLDIILVSMEDCDAVRKAVSEKTGVKCDNILVSATHAHTGPTMRDNSSKYFTPLNTKHIDIINAAIIEACTDAWNKREETAMSYASCEEKECVHNRRYLMENGESMMHPGGPGFPGRLMKEGPEDPQLQLIWFCSGERPVGIIVNYATHPSLLYGKRLVSADFVGVMRRTLQQVYGDVPVLYLQGCCGNVCAIDHEYGTDWGKDALEHAERAGKVLAGDVLRMMNLPHEQTVTEKVRVLRDTIKIKYRELSAERGAQAEKIFELYRQNPEAFAKLNVAEKALANRTRTLTELRAESETKEIPVNAINIGDISIMTNPAELFVEYQLDIKKKLGSRTICVELTDGFISYIPTKQAYLLKGYEVNNGMYDWNTGNEIAAAMKELHDRLD